MRSKADIARELARTHAGLDPAITLIVRLVADREDHGDEPVKLLEVNPATFASGIIPIAFAADREVPYPSLVVEVTDTEYDQIRRGELKLPTGWRLGDQLYSAA
ncbi:MAG: hypothetical protein HUU35_02415 [Armatimonadetes bacterium]|nr:hypothetical protein [Armatimonadota bacterium]